jgi:hypothetical protein
MTKISEMRDPVRRLFAFARERHVIYERRSAGKPPPWTDDPVLRDFRFTNVYRELDRVTRWIAINWRAPHVDDPDLWFAMCVARLLNLPASLEAVKYPVPWRELTFVQRVDQLRHRDGKIFNSAYIVSAPTAPKHAYLASEVLTPLWEERRHLRPKEGDTLNSYHVLLGQMHGFGSFMSAQVVADLKYVSPLREASDWWTFAASGPGSRRGLNYVLGFGRDAPWTEEEWRLELGRLRENLLPMFASAKMPVPHAQDIQNVLCEWSKYYRAAIGGQKPKQKYNWKEAT